MQRSLFRGLTLLSLIFFLPAFSYSQVINVGNGSYTTVLPPGAVGPSYANGAPAFPKVSETFSKHPQTNDFWSSLIFPFFGNPHSNVIHAHPANFKAKSSGLEMGYSPNHVLINNDYVFQYRYQLTIGIEGLNASSTLTEDYSDWTATALWSHGDREMLATIGHGLPFAFFTISGGNASITTNGTRSIWHNQNGVIGLTVDGVHYGIFAPSGSQWTIGSSLTSNLDGKDYLSVAVLPNNSAETLEFFRKRAYAHVVNTRVEWSYDEATAEVYSTYIFEVELKEDINGNLAETLPALYRHHYLYSDDPLTSYIYNTARGEMRVRAGNSFSTRVTFDGVLPSLPDLGVYNRQELLQLVQTVANESLGTGPTYENGKAIGRFARLVHIADQLGAIPQRDHFLNQIKLRLQVWFTAGGPQQYVYNDTWSVLTGYPSGFGADNQINDHHFHHGYAIMGAATIAQYDPEWAAQDQWGGMVNLLIRDANSWDREDDLFPFLRGFDQYAGHSWAAGHADFADGNNQESSSESMHFSTAVILWGVMTNQDDIRDLGIFLYTTERTAIEQYWFDVHDAVFPQNYSKSALGIVWGGKGTYGTWFGGNPEFIHGINFLPITGGSLYLGRHPEYVMRNIAGMEAALGGAPTIWRDVIWQFMSMGNPDRALSEFLANPNYQIFDGESKAHTYHWLGNMKRIGQVDTTVTANVPTFATFRNSEGAMTYVAFNKESVNTDVQFSDGFVLNVEPRSMGWRTFVSNNQDDPIAIISANITNGKAPLTVTFNGGASFDPNGSPITYAWDFDDGNTANTVIASNTFTEIGTYQVTLTVTNAEEFSHTTSVEISVLQPGTPFLGQAPVIPARIEAENFDLGGQLVGYYDVDDNNIGLAYRPNEGVDITGGGSNGFHVYWMVATEWLEYTIEVPESGKYDIIPYLTTVPGFGNFRILINGIDVSGKVNVPGTGSWSNWTPFPVTEVFMEEGISILRFEVGSDSDQTGWLYSMDYIEIVESESTNIGTDPDKPLEFGLEANYPNPFNPTTTIRYTIPEASSVQLEVFTLTGQRVATLVSSEMPAGTHSLQFDAKSLASGVYIYRLQSSQGTVTRKMTLLK